MQDTSCENFFELIKEFLAKEDERRKRENDYNPLLVLNYAYDEVNLHSRMLFFFAEPLVKSRAGEFVFGLVFKKGVKRYKFHFAPNKSVQGI